MAGPVEVARRMHAQAVTAWRSTRATRRNTPQRWRRLTCWYGVCWPSCGGLP